MTTWYDRTLELLEEIRNNGTPEGAGSGATNLKVGDALVSNTNPIPISDAGGAITIDGTIAVSNFPATQQVAGSVAISNLPAVQPVEGTVNVGNFPENQAVSGAVEITNFPAVQPVSGAVEITNLPNLPYSPHEDFGTAAAIVIKSSPGQLFSICAHNFSSSCTRFLQLHDRSTAPVTGDAPKLFFPICGGESKVLGTEFFGLLGRSFEDGIAWAWSTTPKTFSPVPSPSEHATFVHYQ